MLYYLYILYIIIQDSPPFVKYYYEKAINFCKYVAAMLYIYVCVCVCVRTPVHIRIMREILQKKRYLIY